MLGTENESNPRPDLGSQFPVAGDEDKGEEVPVGPCQEQTDHYVKEWQGASFSLTRRYRTDESYLLTE